LSRVSAAHRSRRLTSIRSLEQQLQSQSKLLESCQRENRSPTPFPVAPRRECGSRAAVAHTLAAAGTRRQSWSRRRQSTWPRFDATTAPPMITGPCSRTASQRAIYRVQASDCASGVHDRTRAGVREHRAGVRSRAGCTLRAFAEPERHSVPASVRGGSLGCIPPSLVRRFRGERVVAGRCRHRCGWSTMVGSSAIRGSRAPAPYGGHGPSVKISARLSRSLADDLIQVQPVLVSANGSAMTWCSSS